MFKKPINVRVYISKNYSDGIHQLEFSQIIRSLMYFMNFTKPNITYLNSKLSKFTNNPSMNY